MRTIKLEPQDHDTAFRSFHRDDNNRFNPEGDGWVVRMWFELTDNPDSYMLLMDTGPDGLPDPATEVRVPLHRGLALPRRHAAAVARRRPQRHRAALRADLQLRERADPRVLGRGQPPVVDAFLTGRSTSGSNARMRFGLFMAPFHPTGQNPTLALERDLDLIVHLDRLGFDEVWIGEHHSGGYEIISSPEVFIATAAERTKHIRLGSGVNSLPYHHPLLLADRFVLLDHLTRGRAMLGCGPGQLTSDAHMLGIPADRQRPRMDEALEAIMALLRGETVTMETDWFTLQDARLQLRPYSEPEPRSRGRGIDLPHRCDRRRHVRRRDCCRSRRRRKQGFDALGTHWQTWNEVADQHGHQADREQWRLVGPMHLAETKEQARKDVEYGIVPFSDYFTHVLPAGPVRGNNAQEIIDNVDEDGFAVIGTPDDAIRKIQELVDQSGGFGTFLLFGHDWATTRRDEAQLRAVRPVRHAALPGPARRARERRANGSPGAAASSSAAPRTRSCRRSPITPRASRRADVPAARRQGGGGSCPPSCTAW